MSINENIKGVTRSHILRKDKQYNDEKKKDNSKTMVDKTLSTN